MRILPRRRRATSAPAASPGYALLDAHLVVTGDLETTGSIRIDGHLEGDIRRADVVVIGAGAAVVGDVSAREVVIGGTVTGQVRATERIELQATAVVTGDIESQGVLMQEGAVVNGAVQMRHHLEPVPA